MKVTVSGIDGITRYLKNEVSDLVQRIATETEIAARQNTPIKSGNARRNWKKSMTNESFVIENRVPYIERLEAGASKQAPRGIIGPTLTQVKGKFK
jgi:hypothetical protein